MKTDIIIAGVGGQGILSIAAVIGMAALKNDLFMKQSEVHGMSQRGGAVQSHLRISDDQIFSDLIPGGEADLIISVELMEGLRYLPFLKENGWLVTNNSAFENIPDYPDPAIIRSEIKNIRNHVIVDGDRIAKEIGSPRSSNMVILGAASNFIEIPHLVHGIERIFKTKGESVVDINIKALAKGKKAGELYLPDM